MIRRCDAAQENTFTLETRGGLTPQSALVHTDDQLSPFNCSSSQYLRMLGDNH